MKKLLTILVLGLLFCNVGVADDNPYKNIGVSYKNVKLDCEFGVEGSYYINLINDKIFVDGHQRGFRITDAFLYIDEGGYGAIEINRYTLKAMLRKTRGYQGTCKKVSKKQF